MIVKSCHIIVKKYIKSTLFLLLICSYVHVKGQVVANFSYTSQGDSCGSRSVQFDASASTGPITSYGWEFRSLAVGSPVEMGSGKIVTKNFLAAGTYEATLRVTGGGQTSSKSVNLKVYKAPDVDFTTSVKEGCQPLTVVFKDKSKTGDGTLVRWEWNFNDGKKEIKTTADSVVNVYTNNGFYTPTLIVTNSAGCTKSINKSNWINVYNKITPSFLVKNNFSCLAPHVVALENTSPAGPFNFKWEYGDGLSLVSNEKNTTHAYSKFGSYTIKLTASNTPGNCSSSVQSSGSQNVYIGKPVASFTLPATVCSGQSLSFTPVTDISNVTNAGKWYFGDDGSVVNGINVSHVFNKVGTFGIKYVAYNSFSGCASDTVRKTIQVLLSPTANFTVDRATGCQVPFNVNLTNTSANANSYGWNFGNGEPSVTKSDLSTTAATFTSFNTFNITLVAKNANGCTNSKTLTVKNSKLAFDFDYRPKEGCVPLLVKVTSSIPAGSFVYDYGNGNTVTSTSAIASHTYTSAGSFNVKVKVTTADGCVAESPIKPVKVNAFCDTDGDTLGQGGVKNGSIYVIRDRACNKKRSFIFEDTLSSATLISWNFDGVIVSTSANPYSYTFPSNGKKRFLVTSRMRDNSTGTIIEHVIRVVVLDEKAKFKPSIMNVCKDVNVNFNPIDIDSSLVWKYTWDFGDSSARITINNAANYRSTGLYLKGNISHAFKKYGNYYPKLIIEDRFGCKDSLRYPMPIEVKSPVAKFAISGSKFCDEKFNVKVASLSTSKSIKEWKWDFGDNSTATFNKDTAIVHSFQNTTSFKSYKISLLITDSTGCFDKRDTTILSYVPKARFYTNDTLRCGKYDVSFRNSSTATVKDTNQYLWNYGNGVISSGFKGRQAYTDTGRYTVTLMVKDDGGCMDTMTRVNYVRLVYPKASFNIGGDTSKCIGTFSLPFASTSLYGKQFIWDFGDTSSITITDKSDVSHFYTQPGSYLVKLSIIGLDGCRDSTSKTIRIKGSSEEMTIKDSYLCKGEVFTAVVNGKNIKSYYWDFGDLSSTANFIKSDSVNHIYKRPGRYFPNVILVSPEGCQTTVTLDKPILVDSISAGPIVNIKCGDTTTTLLGFSYLNLTNKYVWKGDSGVTYLPDSNSLVTKVNRAGRYILKTKNDECGMKDTVLVTSSGVIPTVNAGPDRKLDCITQNIQLNGSTTTANTRYKWRGPAGTFFLPSDTVARPVVDKLGKYFLTVNQRQCSKVDSVIVTACTLRAQDSVIRICANVFGFPGTFEKYNLLSLNDHVRSSRPMSVKWYYDLPLEILVPSPDSITVKDGDMFYASITTADSSERARASIKFVIKALPEAPIVNSLVPICQGSERTLSATGNKASTYVWSFKADTTLLIDTSTTNTLHFKAGTSSISGNVIETDSLGCQGDTTNFNIQVDILPTVATVNGKKADTIVYCITKNQKQMLGDTPSVGYGRWNVLLNKGKAKIDTSEARSSIIDFGDMKDTLVAEWIIHNGVCTETKATLTVLPENAFYPKVTLKEMPTVCEGTMVTFEALPGIASGDSPKYSFYDNANREIRSAAYPNTFSFPAKKDTLLYVKMFSNYACLYTDTAISNKVKMSVIYKAVSNIMFNADTLCVENAPITLSAEKNFLSVVTYEWYRKDSLISKSKNVETFQLKEPKESDTYRLKVYNAICPPAYDSIRAKIYEKPELSFPVETVEVMYAYDKLEPIPLQIKPLRFPADISQIRWNPTDYLSHYKGTPRVLKNLEDTSIVQNPLYVAQNREFSTMYWVTVRTGPEGKGCETGSSILVNNYVPVKIPNAFSPNNDGLNETWIITGITKYPQSKVKVFNRWGSIVYQDNNGYHVPWDGSTNGEKLVLGTYYYIIEFLGSTDGSDHTEQGAITIVY